MIAVTARIPRSEYKVIKGHGPFPPEGGMYGYRWRVTQPPPLLYPQEKRNPLPYPAASHPRTRGEDIVDLYLMSDSRVFFACC
ncbi:hypothetical protein AVEN_22588-1 [Araneus ventricosus]|uniref:Uncharacterized protein n=1 Tax=Araneus ventricosus TaxID=182803 RepID=A0A4Y2E535_ARAVE|nr:hypothetical protein AVEN_22588-1 [Araneus ventricosus]